MYVIRRKGINSFDFFDFQKSRLLLVIVAGRSWHFREHTRHSKIRAERPTERAWKHVNWHEHGRALIKYLITQLND